MEVKLKTIILTKAVSWRKLKMSFDFSELEEIGCLHLEYIGTSAFSFSQN